MHMYMILAYDSFQNMNIFRITYLNDKFSGTLKNSRCLCRTRKPHYVRVRNSMIIKAFEKRDL